MYGDPDELDKLAAQLRSRAAQIREHAADHVRLSSRARWVSTAADTYREKVRQDREKADRAADELNRAAALLEAHAQEVRETIARIARIERETVDWFQRQAHGLAEKAEHIVDTVADSVKRVIQEPWSGWPYRPDKLPPPGDRQWLEVGDFMRRQGAI